MLQYNCRICGLKFTLNEEKLFEDVAAEAFVKHKMAVQHWTSIWPNIFIYKGHNLQVIGRIANLHVVHHVSAKFSNEWLHSLASLETLAKKSFLFCWCEWSE